MTMLSPKMAPLTLSATVLSRISSALLYYLGGWDAAARFLRASGPGGCRLCGEGSFNLRKLAWCHGVNTHFPFQLKADDLFPST